MKLLLMGDLHIRYKTPAHRKDDFFATQFEKVCNAIRIASEHGCSAILQAGDMWDNPNPPRQAMSLYIDLLRSSALPFYTIYGQHDMLYRNYDHVDRTPTYLLEKAGALHTVGIHNSRADLGNVYLHGLSYDQEQSFAPVAGATNVLIAHASVGDKPLFPGHVLTAPQAFLAQHPWADLILVGDYHYPFEDTLDGRVCVNAGVVVRKSVAQRDMQHHPRVVIYDTVERSTLSVVLPHAPAAEVFDVPEEQPQNDQLLRFVDALKRNRAIGISFEENLTAYYAENRTRPAIREVIAKAMEAE